MRRPTKEELLAAAGGTVPDVIAPGLDVLFCGINPGLYSAATRQHFARPGNRFWPALHRSGFTPRQFAPSEAKLLLPLGYGMTMMVRRGTATAAELSDEEFKAGGRALVRKIRKYKPGVLAVLGVGAYRAAFDRRAAPLGLQKETVDGTPIWLLPNPSGLNANYQLGDLVALFSDLRRFVEARRGATKSA
ncbi:MAG: G/U mismatch-specific DNA glycosylase [Gemmatimonadota bacterium]